MRVALYARVSMDETQEDRRYQEPENQLVPLREFSKALGHEVVFEFVDRASGGDSNRPQFIDMMNKASQHKFSGIIVWKADRFSREGVIATMSYIQRLRRRNVWLKSMTEGWLDTQQEGIADLILAIMAWASAEERKKISDRTKAGIAQRRAIGQWKGGRPKGSKDSYVRKRGGVITNPETSSS